MVGVSLSVSFQGEFHPHFCKDLFTLFLNQPTLVVDFLFAATMYQPHASHLRYSHRDGLPPNCSSVGGHSVDSSSHIPHPNRLHGRNDGFAVTRPTVPLFLTITIPIRRLASMARIVHIDVMMGLVDPDPPKMGCPPIVLLLVFTALIRHPPLLVRILSRNVLMAG